MARVKIKHKGLTSRENKLKLLEILCKNEIHVTKVIDAHDGYAVLLLNEAHAEHVFIKKVKEELQQNDFSSLMPPDLKVKKSVIASRLDDLIYERSEEEIFNELSSQNQWIGDDLDSIFKFPNSNTIKITFTQTSQAKKCTEKGLLAFNLSIPPNDVKLETYIHITCCMRCYALEKHNTRDCSKDRNYKICSECSQEGHFWYNCKEKDKNCINCGGNHSTLAMRCSKRKEIVKEKRKEEAERGRQTYAGIAGASATHALQTNIANSTHSTPLVTREDTLKINICITHAHYMNMANPGTYEGELNKILTLNNLPKIKIPSIPDSRKIFNSMPQQSESRASEAPEVKPRKEREGKHSNEQGKESKEVQIDRELEEMEQEIQPKDSKEIGLQIFTTDERGWPTENFTIDDLITGINHNIYKYTFTDNRFSEEQVMKLIKNSDMSLRSCWNMIGKDVFRKIRNGFLKDRSPIQNRDPRQQKLSNDN